MRIKICFANPAEITYLPINTNFYLVQLLEQLTFEYRRYLKSLIPGEQRASNFNLYTFSQLIVPERKIQAFKIGIQSSEFYWYVASPYYQFLGLLAKELRNRQKVKIYNKWFSVKHVHFICSPEFRTSEARFTCLSPIAVYKQQFNNRHPSAYQFNGGYILPDSNDYKKYIERDLVYKYNILAGGRRKHLDMKLEFDPNYIRKRKNRITKVITLENGDTLKEHIKGVLAPLTIQAEPEILQMIYDTGLGQLNNLGFGMLETIAGN